MGSHDPFGNLKHKLWSKDGSGVKLVVWLSTIESQESIQFICMQVACDPLLESSQWRLQLCFRPHLNWRFVPKVVEVPIMGILGLPFGSLRTKCHLDVGLVKRYIIYYKGKVVASPKSRLWWVLWVGVCLWWVLAPKNVPTMH
jgi:hypothetical protein